MDETLEIKDVVEQGEKKEGYIKDFISGISVRATPEEVESGFPAFRRVLSSATHGRFARAILSHRCRQDC